MPIPRTPALMCPQGLSAAFPSGSIQTSENISCVFLHRTTCFILCSANLTGLATSSELFLVNSMPRPQCLSLSNLGYFLQLNIYKSDRISSAFKSNSCSLYLSDPHLHSNLLQAHQQLKHPHIRMVSAGCCLCGLFLDITAQCCAEILQH